MKNLMRFALIVGFLFLSNPAHALFVNGGFESGDFSGWTLSGSGTNLSATQVISAATPMLYGQTTSINPYYGNYMARLQDLDGNYHTTTISQSDTLTAGDLADTLYVRWGALLIEPSNEHPLGDQPYFDINILKNNVSIGTFHADALTKQGGGWTQYGYYGGEAWYRTDIFTFDLSAFSVGDAITVNMSVHDCGWGGHGGVAFLDGIGTTPITVNAVPEPSTMLLLGFGSLTLAALGRRRR